MAGIGGWRSSLTAEGRRGAGALATRRALAVLLALLVCLLASGCGGANGDGGGGADQESGSGEEPGDQGAPGAPGAPGEGGGGEALGAPLKVPTLDVEARTPVDEAVAAMKASLEDKCADNQPCPEVGTKVDPVQDVTTGPLTRCQATGRTDPAEGAEILPDRIIYVLTGDLDCEQESPSPGPSAPTTSEPGSPPTSDEPPAPESSGGSGTTEPDQPPSEGP